MKMYRSISSVVLVLISCVGLICDAGAKPWSGGSGSSGSGSSGSSSTASTASAAPGSSSTATIQSQMLAYGAIDHISGNIAQSVCGDLASVPDSTIVIYDQASFASLQSYTAFLANARLVEDAYGTLIADRASLKKQVDEVWNRYKEHLKKISEKVESEVLPVQQAPLPEPESGSSSGTQQKSGAKPDGFVSATGLPLLHDDAALDRSLLNIENDQIQSAQLEAAYTLTPTVQQAQAIVPLLSSLAVSSNTETPGSVSIPDSAVAIAVSRELEHCKNQRFTLAYPPLFGAGSASDIARSHITTFVRVVDVYRKQAHAEVGAANEDFLKKHDEFRNKGSVGGDGISTSALTDINTLYDNFMNALLQPNGSTGAPGSVSIIQGYQLAMLLGGSDKKSGRPAVPPAYILLASVVAAGGTEHSKKTFWTNLTTGDKITYSGGAVVNFALWKAGGKVPLENRVLRYETPFLKIKQPCHSLGVADGANFSPKDYYADDVAACDKVEPDASE